MTTAPAPSDTESPRDAPTWGAGVAAQSAAILALGIIAAHLAVGTLSSTAPVDAITSAIIWVTLASAVALAVWRNGTGHPTSDLRLRVRGIDVAIGLLIGGGLQCVAILISALMNGGRLSFGGTALLGGQLPAWFWLTAIAGPIVIGPVLEELFFRGVLQRALVHVSRRALGDSRGAARTAAVVAVGVTAVAFALAHLALNPSLGALGTIMTLAVGIACGALVELTGRLGPALCAHVAYNGVAVGFMLAM